jgi:signal-transduction protein with cAMP-binding, CBS, and nucleotidyltransferase domain
MITAEDILKEKGEEIICVSPEHSLHDALKIMLAKKIGAIVVKDGGNFVGIWTERDLMRNTVNENFDPSKAKIKDYMSTNLMSAQFSDSIYHLMDKFLGKRLRHLLIEKDGKYIGFLSAGDVTKALLVEKTEELEKLNKLVNMDYYENWRWKNK